MGRFKIKIDGFLFTLLVGIVVLYGFSKPIKKMIQGEESVLKKFQLLGDIAHLPDTGNPNLFLYDQYFELSYSVNGGDTYTVTNDLTNRSVFISDLYHYITSYRSKPTFAEQPEIKSILVKAKHKFQNVFVEPSMITFPIGNKHELPVISIVSSEKELFSDTEGILTLGQDAWYNDGYYKPFWNKNANYKKRGDQSKRKAYWQYIVNKKVRFSMESDLQVSGNATRSFPQKSFKLKAHKLYGNEAFKYSFFGKKGLNKYTSLVLRNSGNDNIKTLFADMIMHKLARKSNVLTQRGKAIVLYLNGNYWGVYNLRERLDVYMIASKEKSKPENITVLEGGNGRLKDGNEKEATAFIELIQLLEKSETQNIFKVAQTQVDLLSFMDYIILETFYGNGDWLHNNALWYRVKGQKWKWILNDLDYALAYQGANNVTKNYFNYLKNNQTVNAKLFSCLISNIEFKKSFKLRAKEILEILFTDKIIDKAFKKKKDKIQPEIRRHFNRWTGSQTINSWEESIALNIAFLKNRKTFFLKQIDKL